MITKENKVKFFCKRKISTETFIYLSPGSHFLLLSFLISTQAFWVGKLFFSASLCIFLPPKCLVSFLTSPKDRNSTLVSESCTVDGISVPFQELF